MVTLAICDDDPIHLKYTASLVQKELLSSELSLALYSAPKGLLASIREGSYCPDIVILDIELGQENGIPVSRSPVWYRIISHPRLPYPVRRSFGLL